MCDLLLSTDFHSLSQICLEVTDVFPGKISD